MEDAAQLIRRRKWRWLGHTLRHDSIARAALVWNPQGSRRRGRPRITWRSTVLKEAGQQNLSWNELKTIAVDRGGCVQLVEALCSPKE